VSSGGGSARAPSSRSLPAVALLLLAAAAVAVGPVLGGWSWSAPYGPVGSAPFSAAGESLPIAGTVDPSRNNPELGVPPRSPSRAALRHSTAGTGALERPAFDAVLSGVLVAGSLLALLAGQRRTAWPRGVVLRETTARGPPASLA